MIKTHQHSPWCEAFGNQLSCFWEPGDVTFHRSWEYNRPLESRYGVAQGVRPTGKQPGWVRGHGSHIYHVFKSFGAGKSHIRWCPDTECTYQVFPYHGVSLTGEVGECSKLDMWWQNSLILSATTTTSGKSRPQDIFLILTRSLKFWQIATKFPYPGSDSQSTFFVVGETWND